MKKLYQMKSTTCNQRLSKKTKKNSDEFYTPRITVEKIIEFIRPEHIKDKIIYLPCDREDSYFTIVFKEWKDKLQYKELIYTWDDFRTHDELFDKCDLVVTNPPFSLQSQFYEMLHKHNCNFVCIAFSTIGNILYKYTDKNYRLENLGFDKELTKYLKSIGFTRFITPDGTENFNDSHVSDYNLAVSAPGITYFKRKETLPYIRLFADYEGQEQYYDNYRYNNEKVLNINYVYDIPLDYDGYFGVPCTITYSKSPIVDNIQILELVKDTRINGKYKFQRFCCKWKDFNWNKKFYDK